MFTLNLCKEFSKKHALVVISIVSYSKMQGNGVNSCIDQMWQLSFRFLVKNCTLFQNLGVDLQHISTGLRRNAAYKFRLQSQNEEGKSPWSDDVAFFTLPDVPGPPLRPASKGRIHPHSFKVRWDPPHDDGGSTIENYILEIDGGHGECQEYC